MALNAESRMGLALMSGTMVFAIFQVQMPSMTDVRTVEAGNEDIQSQERAATWMSALAVSAIALAAKSSEVFVVGGIMVVGMSWGYKYVDQVSPITKKATGFLTADGIARAQMPDAPEAATAPAATPVYAPVI